jgi:ribosome-associated heat shock protein Hsp15
VASAFIVRDGEKEIMGFSSALGTMDEARSRRQLHRRRARRLWQRHSAPSGRVRRATTGRIPIIRDMGDERLRIDKWLWAARFFKTRSLAAQAIDLGRVRIDGARIKAARELRIGDRLEIHVGDVPIEVVVRALSAQRGPAPMARLLYEETLASTERRARRQAARAYAPEPARDIKGRPTKREGRELRRLRGA